jgi:hypothetical protein
MFANVRHTRQNVIVGAVLLATAACGSNQGDDPAQTAVTVKEALTIDASAETRGELGVVVWGAGVDAQGTRIFHGYDAGSKQVIELRQAVADLDPQHRVTEVTLSGAHGQGTMRTSITSTPNGAAGSENRAVKVEENSFVDNADARRVLALLAADTAATPARTTATGAPSGSLVTPGVHPSTITLINGYCTDLTPLCTAVLVETVGGIALAAKGCGLTVADTAIMLICDIATAETGAGPLACTAAALPAVTSEALQCAMGLATAVHGADDVREKCLKKC